MSAMAVGNEVYLSTTLKGPAFMYNDTIRNTVDDSVVEEVALALKRCQVESHDGNTGHRTGAACGEPLAAQQWCATNKDVRLKDQKAVVVTWGKWSYDGPDNEVGVVNPCQRRLKEWGCKSFLRRLM